MRLEKYTQKEFDSFTDENEVISKPTNDSSKKHHRRHHTRRHNSKSRSSKKSRSKMQGFRSHLYYGLHLFVQLILILIDKVLEFALGWHWGEKQICPSINNDFFLSKSATELAQMIRTKQITSEKVVTAYYNRMLETNKLINFIAEGPYEEAIEIAKLIDKKINSGEVTEEEFDKKPFLGIPFTTKESTAVKGKSHTLGIIARKNVRATEDAECVRLMREAGGILLALTNIPEVNRWQETRNKLFGQTNNPYDTRRTVGGSSGGEGAAITSCASAIGIGTDIGGSIRMPAFFCGIYGHKPTMGAVNMRGCTFRTGEEKQTMVGCGPMSRYATDLMPLFKVLVDDKKSAELKLNEPVDVKKLRYFYITENSELRNRPPTDDLQSAMKKAVTHLQNLTGEPVKQTKLTGTDYSTKLWRYWIHEEPGETFSELIGNGIKINGLNELSKYVRGKSELTLAAIYPLIDEQVFPKESPSRIRRLTQQCEDELNELLGDDGILLYHSTPLPAPFHYHALFKFYMFSYWGLFNVIHTPVTQVPLGLNADGLPLGIQIVATKNRDRHCIAVAEELERAFGGWVPPFKSKE